MDVWLALILSYGTYPVYIMADDGVIECELPPELADDKELDDLFWEIQHEYESLFIANDHEFTYVGFKTNEAHNAFVDKLLKAIALLVKKNDGRYRIENRLDKDYLKKI